MNKTLKKIGKWLLIGILVILLLLLSLNLLLKLPVVQKYVIDEVTTFLSDELKTEVKIDSVSLALFDKVVFKNFYVEDLAGEELIFAKYLEANFNTGLWALLNKQLELNEVTLRHAKLNTKRKNGQLTITYNLLSITSNNDRKYDLLTKNQGILFSISKKYFSTILAITDTTN